MIFQFPDLDTFHLAVAGAQIPVAISLSPVEVAFAADGVLSVAPVEAAPPRTMQNALKRLGASVVKEHASSAVETLTCWPQVIPLRREPGLPDGAAQGNIVFEMPTSALAEVVGEMLRLGNDRQSYRFLTSTQDAQDQRVLLKVLGPPYYTLLRALDHLQTKSGARLVAYLERSPRVWVEVGYNHPMIDQLKASEGQTMLLRSPRSWTVIDNKPFQDIYDILDFKLPTSAVEWEESTLAKRLSVPLRLVPGNAADVPEMWLLQEDAFGKLDELVRDADDRVMKRLTFAIATTDQGSKVVLIKASGSKLPPPTLELPHALRLKPFWKLPNLFLPVGTRLQPTLRRDAVRQLLADDPAQIVWLVPGSKGGFKPQSIPEQSFNPLEDWIDYVIDQNRETLTAWIEATQFDFDSFVCREDGEKPKAGGGPGKTPRVRPTERPEAGESESEDLTPKAKKKADKTKAETSEYSVPLAVAPPSELKIRQEEIEKEFLANEGSLDSPQRLHLWPELARVYAAQNNSPDAAISWMNVLWEQDSFPELWLREWVHAENRSAKRELSTADLKQHLSQPTPSPSEVRGFAAHLIWACRDEAVSESVKPRLPEIHKYLEANEKQMSIRAVWLTWLTLSRLEGSDVLALARVRDRLLQRLLEEGLNSERDLPTFLRFAGLRDSDRMRMVRDKAMNLEKMALRWIQLDNDHANEINRAYVSLLFAFGLARLGDATLARDRIEEAGNVLQAKWESNRRSDDGKVDPVHDYLFEAFKFRIEQALSGKPHAGPLSIELLDRLDQVDLQHRGANKTASLPRYMIDRMREQSRVLDPQEKFNPYRPWMKQSDELLKELAELPDIKKVSELHGRIEKILKEGSKGRQTAEDRILILNETIPLAPRIGEEFTSKLLLLVPSAIDALNKASEEKLTDSLCKLLEKSLFQAAHFDRTELVQLLTQKFTNLLRTKTGKTLHTVIDLLAGQCLRSLRKLGMRDEIHKLLNVMSDQLIQGKSLAQLRAVNPRDWHETVRALLQLSGGWLYFGEVDKAIPFLDEAHHVLFEDAELIKHKQFQEYTKLARTYATVLGLGPVDMALARIEELFKRMAKLPNSFTTATHYSRFHLNIVEDVVMAIVSEEFALGPTARRWLDDDEYLVRRRIHQDMKKHLTRSGI